MAYDKTQQTRIVAGLCKDCGNPRGADGTTIRCRECATKIAKRASARKERLRQEWEATQLCYNCGAMRDNETVLCTPCREKKNKHGREYAEIRRVKHTSSGMCKKCGKDRYSQSNYCRMHFMENIARKYGVPMALYEVLLQKLENANFTCFYTAIPLIPGVNACVDHLYPRSLHPDRLSDLDNLVWCDKWINRMKGSMSYQEFISLCQTIVNRACQPVERR